MRTTVGPLPSAVYWRRRAVVLGAVLLGIIVLFVSCSGNDDRKADPRGTSATTPVSATASASGTPDVDDSAFVDSVPGNGPALPDPSAVQTSPPIVVAPVPSVSAGAAGTGDNTNVNAAAGATCADSELSVTPIAAATNIKRGAEVAFTLKIKNIGTRSCNRDIGSDPQELYLDLGARLYWSSDKCATVPAGHNTQQLAPGFERTFNVTWNGRQSSSCTNGAPSGPNPPPGQFALRARLGTLISQPLALTLSA